LIELLIRSIFVGLVGVSARYIFYKVIGKKKSIDYLLGKNLSEEESDKQNLYNALVGMIAGFFLILIILYIIFK
jgi:hypothetical protein